MSVSHSSNDIAIVGMSALFAQASDLQSYWQNIFDQVDAVTKADSDWMGFSYDPNSRENDRLCTNKGGFLHDLAQFDPMEFGIMPNAVNGGGPDQYLAIKLSRDALQDAGYIERPFNRQRTGVIFGYGSYMNRGFANLLQHGLVVDQTLALLQQLAPHIDAGTLMKVRHGLKESLPPFTPEICPGLVPNNVSGRVANRLDLMGPNYVIDAACASSLISVHLGIEELLRDRCDMMLVGGINASTPAPISMIFNQLGALTRHNIRPFDAAASGTLLGEGLGVLVIKRLADAERDGDRIYAVLKGVGSSSDGKALSSVAPRLEGEMLALQRAYQTTKLDPSTIGLVEAHGTSIPLGDQTEVASLTAIFGQREGLFPRTALGSVKSMISHCTTAAGVAGLIKAALALYHKVLPPTLCDEVNPSLELEKTPFYINNQTRPWIYGDREIPRRAAVNSFGFGGINAHAILEEYRGSAEREPELLHRDWPTEIFVFAASTQESLLEQIAKVQKYLEKQPDASVADLAYTLSQQTNQGNLRLAVVASNSQDLTQKLTTANHKLANNQHKNFKTRSGIFYSQQQKFGSTIFLFPGEGAQYSNMLLDLCLFFPSVRQWFDLLDEAFKDSVQPKPSSVIFPAPNSLTKEARQFAEDKLMGMDIGPATVFVSSMALYELIAEFGVVCDAMVGHSSGENTALTASNTVFYENRSQLIEKMGYFNEIVQELESSNSVLRGTMLAVGGIKAEVITQIAENLGNRVQIAMDNCSNQMILFGSEADIGNLHEQLQQQGGMCMVLPFDRAYHTPYFAEVSKALREFYNTFNFQKGTIPIYSCAKCDRFPDDPDEMRDLAAYQWSARVRFRELVAQLYADGFRTFVEIGPSRNLTAFVEDILRGKKDYLAVATNNRQKTSLEQLQLALGELFVGGMDLTWTTFFRYRKVVTVDLEENTKIDVTRRKLTIPVTLPVARLSPDIAQKVRAELTASGTISQHNSKQSVEVLSAIATTGVRQGENSFNISQEQAVRQEQNPAVENENSERAIAKVIPSDIWPFLGQILEQDEHHLICERQIDLQHDIFLQDHVFGGKLSQYQPELTALPVIPLTFSMEIIAEAANYLLGGIKTVVSLHNLRAYRWLTLDHGRITLRSHAQLQESTEEHPTFQTVYVRLFQLGLSQMESGVLVFEGEVRLRNTYEPSPAPRNIVLNNPVLPGLSDADLYHTCMFHGDRLQGVKHLQQWSNDGIEGDLEVLPTDAFFSHTRYPVFQLDPGLLDAAGQLVGYWISEQWGPEDSYCFPFHVDAIYQYVDPLSPGTLVVCRSAMHFTNEHQIEANFELLDTTGRIIGRIEGWKDICYQVPRNNFYPCRISPQSEYLSDPWMQVETGTICRLVSPFPENFLDTSWSIWKRMLAHLMLSQVERNYWYTLPETGSRRTDWLLGRVAAKDAIRQWSHQVLGINLAPVDVEIYTTETGKPYAYCPTLQNVVLPDISISHTHGYMVAALGLEGMHIGIDLERQENCPSYQLLQEAFTPNEKLLLEQLSPDIQPMAMLGIWCAKEAAAKSAGIGLGGKLQAWEIIDYTPGFDHLTVTHAEQDFSVRIWYTHEEVLAICLIE